MMLIGKIFKAGAWWVAEAPLIGVYTQGKSRKDAEEMLADAVQEVVHRDGFTVTVTNYDAEGAVLIEPNHPSALASYVLKYQREIHGMSLADVAKALGASSRNAYASYEQGRTEPTLGKFRELLHAVAPEMGVIVGPRAKATTKRASRSRRPVAAARSQPESRGTRGA